MGAEHIERSRYDSAGGVDDRNHNDRKRIELIDCRDSARQVLFDPSIVEAISEDGTGFSDLPRGPIYLTGFVGDDIIGCFVIEKRNRSTADVHVQVLPQYRDDYAADFGRSVINWTWKNTEFLKLVAEIPVTYPNVLRFALSMGFEMEGMNCKSIVKGGRLVDQWYVGLTRG